MRNFFYSLAVVFTSAITAAAANAACNPNTTLGVSRTIIVDTKGGGKYGQIQYKKTLDLKPGEVVLTFDDGPHPKNTASILKTLEAHCTKATFFAVGQMVRTYPGMLRKVAAAGHTIAAHTHTHPNLSRLSTQRAIYEIERSFAEIIQATGKPVAPFFRFPGLAHSENLNKYLGKRNIATLSVDIISNDTRYRSPSAVLRNTLHQLKKKKKGMILMHDLKNVAARTLPSLLRELKRRKYKIVHIVPARPMRKAAYVPKPLKTYAKKRQKPGIKTASTRKRRPTHTKKKYGKKYKIARRHKRNKKPLVRRVSNTPSKSAGGKKNNLKLCLFLLFGCIK